MTNKEIVRSAMIANGIDPNKHTADTYVGWNKRGYVIKSGESASFVAVIWKPSPSGKMHRASVGYFTDIQVVERDRP